VLAYRVNVGRLIREIDLRPLSEIPASVVLNATPGGLMWDVFAWGMVDSAQIAVLDHAPMRRVQALFDDWEKDSGVTLAEIRQLIALHMKHPEELEIDLIDRGLRWRNCPSPEFNWRDLRLVVHFSSVDSHIVSVTNPKRAGWNNFTMLMADMVDSLNWLVWAKTESAQKGGSPPAQIERPGVAGPQSRPGAKVKPSTLSRIKEISGWNKRHGVDGSAEDPESKRRKVLAAFNMR
jgi:Family of unknown function (DUF5361)